MASERTPDKIHVSVLLEECLQHLRPRPDGLYVDGTLGLGGHTEGILAATSPGGKVIAFEWDQKAQDLATERLKKYGDRLRIIPRNFAEIAEGLNEVVEYIKSNNLGLSEEYEEIEKEEVFTKVDFEDLDE